jgi:hypothetical protein
MATLATGEARDVRVVVPVDPAFQDPRRRERIEKLLMSYPNIRADELQEIVSFLRSGKQFDVGMVCGDERFTAKLSDIRRSNPDSFGSTLTHTIWFLVLLFLPLALVCALPMLLGRA